MELTPYLSSIRSGVQDAAALADDPTRQIAERLAGSVDAASRLALLQALADAAAEISVELAPGSVALQMHGAEPVFVVHLPRSTAAHDVTVLESADEPDADEAPAEGDEPQARVSLRLPQSVKAKVDEYADADGVSTNTWLLQRVLEALTLRDRGRGRPRSGWSPAGGREGLRLEVPRAVPPLPPLPPPFRPEPPRAGEADHERHGHRAEGRRSEGGSASVQGWVR